jgi:hypothetical protein
MEFFFFTTGVEMKLFTKLFLLTALFTSYSANAQIIVDTTNNSNFGIGPSLSLSEIDYKNEDDNVFGVERNTIGLGVVGGITRNVSLLFQAGHTYESKFNESKLEGEGYMFGGGIGFEMYSHKRVTMVGYGLLNYVSDTYKLKNHRPKKEIKMTVTDLHLGWITLLRANQYISLFGGLDLVPYSDGKITYRDYELEVERDDLVNLKLGMSFDLPSVTIKPEVTLIGEKTFTMMVTFDI